MCRGKTWSRRDRDFHRPDFDQQKTRDQTHFVEQEPENEILCGERAVERRLHDEHGRVERAASIGSRLRKQCEWNDQGGEQYEQQAQAIDAHQIFGVDSRNPRMTFHELESSRGGIEIPPQRQGASGRDDIKHQRNRAAIAQPARRSLSGGGRPCAHRHCAEQRNQNNRRD